jgi:hypothetical protein
MLESMTAGVGFSKMKLNVTFLVTLAFLLLMLDLLLRVRELMPESSTRFLCLFYRSVSKGYLGPTEKNPQSKKEA